MIIDFILNFLYSIIDGLLSVIFNGADVVLPSGITSAISTAGGYLSAFDFIVPISSILTVFGLILTIEGAILIYKSIMWIIRRLPTQS